VAESNPWEILCVDLIGKYQFTTQGGIGAYKLKINLHAVSRIDPATGWVKINAVPLACTVLVANQVELLVLLTQSPKPEKVSWIEETNS